MTEDDIEADLDVIGALADLHSAQIFARMQETEIKRLKAELRRAQKAIKLAISLEVHRLGYPETPDSQLLRALATAKRKGAKR